MGLLGLLGLLTLIRSVGQGDLGTVFAAVFVLLIVILAPFIVESSTRQIIADEVKRIRETESVRFTEE